MVVSPSQTPFLSDAERRDDSLDDEFQEKSFPLNKRRSRCGSITISAAIFHSLMIFVYAVLTIAFIVNKYPQKQSLTYSPVGKYVEYQAVIIPDDPHAVKESPYVGMKSSPELDAAWYRLLRHHNIRLNDDDLEGINQTSVPLGNGGGYLGMLGVFHELHCLKLVREALHMDYYGVNRTEAERKTLAGHAEHCIDTMRQMAMCRADTTIFPYHWTSFTRLPAPTWKQTHECVNWDRFEEWLDARVVNIHEPGLLIHPDLGPSYPDG